MLKNPKITTTIKNLPESNFSVLDIPDILTSQFRDLEQINVVALKTWAVGLEMEATYVLNPLDTEKWFLKSFFVPDFKKIIEYIAKKYNSSKYSYIVEAEVSGRTCAGVSVIKPDPRHSMLEIATDRPYKYTNKAKLSNDILFYVSYLMEIQEGAIKNLNDFYNNEKFWKKKKIFNSFVPYPYAMSDRLKNANIILGSEENTKNKTNYTGSYHVTLTLPFQPFETTNNKKYYENYKSYINQFQWVEPLIIALYTTTDMRGIGSETEYSRASYRILLSGWGNPGGSDVRKFDQGLTRKVNIPLYWRKGINFPGQDKLQKYCADPKRKYNEEYVDPDRDLYDMGGDFRTPSGQHGETWNVRDKLKGTFYGVEMRILDYFPPKHMSSLIRLLVFIAENARGEKNNMFVYQDKDWIDTMHSVFKSGWRAEIPMSYINKLEKVLKLKFNKKPKKLFSFFNILVEELHKKNKNGFFVEEMLPNYLDNDFFLTAREKEQPKLELRNPNRESWDFGFLLKLSDSKETREIIKKTFQSLEINRKIKFIDLEKHYLKRMPKKWKNNLIDILYFLEYREGLTLFFDSNQFIKFIKISSIQNKNISSIIDNYIGSIIQLWPELIKYNSGKN